MFIKSRRVIFKDKIDKAVLKLEDEKISVYPYDYKQEEITDYGDLYIAPGLIDIHNHGYAGWTFTGTSNAQDLEDLSIRLLKEGVTSMLATSSLQYYDKVSLSVSGAEVLGIHAEGPFLNPEQHGAAPPDTPFKEADNDHLLKMIQDSGNTIKMMTVAVECITDEMLETLRDHKIKVAAGHSNASYDLMMSKDKYVDSLTHLGNAMSGLHHRNIGLFGYGLMSHKWVELISDGNHISKAMLEMIFKLKSKEEIILVSDTIALGGCDHGSYDTVFGELWIDETGTIINAYNHLSGSSHSLREDIDYLHKTLKISYNDLFLMASYNPAQFLGYEDRGVIADHKLADLIIFDDDLTIQEVYKKGLVKYKHTDDIMMQNERLQEILQDQEFMNFYSINYEGEKNENN